MHTGCMAAEVDRVTLLLRTLVWVADRQPRACYQQAGDQYQRKHPVLAQIVKTIKGEDAWRDSPSVALIDVLRGAINELPEEMSGRYPRNDFEAKREPNPGWKGSPERRMAEIMYGFRDDEVSPRFRLDGSEAPKTYDGDYLLAALRLAHAEYWSARNKGRITRIIREDLADVLLAMEQAAIARAEQAAITAQAEAGRSDYISRSNYEQWLADRHREGARLLLLYGDAGTGKTALARHFGEQVVSSPIDFVEIDTQTPEALIDDIVLALDHRGVDIPMRDVLVKKRFKEFLSSDQAPGVVLLDNVEDWRLVTELVSIPTKVTVIVASRYRLAASQDIAALLVEEMTHDEATAMVHSRLERVSEDDANCLAEALGYRPLAIKHACGFLSQDNMPIEEFCELLERDITTVFDSVADDEPTLTTIYRMSIDRLDADSLSLIDLIVAAGGGNVPSDFLQAMWRPVDIVSLQQGDDPLRILRLKKGLRVLERRSLIQKLDEEDDLPFIWIHSLTREILYSLRTSQCETIYRESLELVSTMLALSDWQAGRSLPVSITVQTPDFRWLLSSLVRLMRDVKPYPHLARLAAFVVHGETQNEPSNLDTLRFARNILERYWRILTHNLQRRNGVAPSVSYQKINGIAKHTGTYEEPDDGPDYDRRRADFVALRFELFTFSSLLPGSWMEKNMHDYRYPYLEPLPGEEVLSHLLLGTEWYPRGAARMLDQSRDYLKSRLRTMALSETYNGHPFYVGGYYFALGTLFFDSCDYRRALGAYRRSFECWSNDSRRNVGEMCKASARIAESYCRLANYEAAETWRQKTIAVVSDHVRQFDARDWTCPFTG
jgi:hypothetical protein